jgi:TfoX/Sxy family transcriptional regulator of competence genes
MAFDAELADRVREIVGLRDSLTERKMFGGIAWMLNGNMACGVLGEELIVRVGPEAHEQALAEPHTREFDLTGRPSRGMVVVQPPALADDAQLAGWVDAGADFALSLPPK